MKKQLLLLTSCLLITISAQCMQPEDKKSSLLAAADSNTQNPSLDFFKRHSETIEQELARIVKNSEQAEESKKDKTFDHSELLRQLNIDAQLIRKSIDTCAKSSFEGENFAHDHLVLSVHTSKFYAKYLAEKQNAKICVNSPAYNALLGQIERLLDLAKENGTPARERENRLLDSITGLARTLTEAKLKSNKK